MSLEKEMLQAKTNQERVAIARKGIRAYIDGNTIPLITSKQVSLMEYGDVCFALGMLGCAAAKEAKRRDNKGE